MKRLSLLTLTIIALAGCTGRHAKPAGSSSAPGDPQEPASEVRRIEVPAPPKMLNAGPELLDFYARHYWDLFDYSDTTLVDNEQTTEQFFANWLDLISRADHQTATAAISESLTRCGTHRRMFVYLCELYEKYLHDPNSPMMNEELFIPVLETMTASPLLDDTEKIRPRELHRMALKNRIGTLAADFTYTLASGAQGTLYGIKAPITLLFINNPGCPACKQVREDISASQLLTQLIDDGTIKVLAIYPDEDLGEWRDYAPNMPASWINSYDKALAMRDRELYDLKAIPTVYLLDSDKRVILKDCMHIPMLEQTAYALLQQMNY